MNEWYVVKGEKRQGPFTLEKMARYYAENRVNAQTIVWHEGMPAPAPMGQSKLTGVMKQVDAKRQPSPPVPDDDEILDELPEQFAPAPAPQGPQGAPMYPGAHGGFAPQPSAQVVFDPNLFLESQMPVGQGVLHGRNPYGKIAALSFGVFWLVVVLTMLGLGKGTAFATILSIIGFLGILNGLVFAIMGVLRGAKISKSAMMLGRGIVGTGRVLSSVLLIIHTVIFVLSIVAALIGIAAVGVMEENKKKLQEEELERFMRENQREYDRQTSRERGW
ncbi:MAG: DUF4339 domain-containing protein [Planctomycetes bacterium]|nr:DUF4339 domain-containing protein [Planctomycetota bacterium]